MNKNKQFFLREGILIFTQKSFIGRHLATQKRTLKLYKKHGYSRFENEFGKFDDISTSLYLFDLEIEIRCLELILKAWEIIEENNIGIEIRESIKVNIYQLDPKILKFYPSTTTYYLELDEVSASAANAILIYQ